MDYTGYTRKFPNNRPLNAFDREHRLLQKKRLDVVPLAHLCVVKMNSNCLVSVDRWFAARGFAALLGAIGIAFGLGGVLMLLWLLIVNRLPNENGLWEAIFIGMAMLAAFTAASIWVACLELFRWTYYPIALDRKHRQIHVFGLDGTTLSVPWDQVYFTLGRGTGTFGWYNWDVRGLILDADGVTVRETFAFCIATSRIENAHAHWEFLRRYMEEGPAAVVDAVRYCMPLDGKRELRVRQGAHLRRRRAAPGFHVAHDAATQLPAHDHALGGDADQQDSAVSTRHRGAPDTGRR